MAWNNFLFSLLLLAGCSFLYYYEYVSILSLLVAKPQSAVRATACAVILCSQRHRDGVQARIIRSLFFFIRGD